MTNDEERRTKNAASVYVFGLEINETIDRAPHGLNLNVMPTHFSLYHPSIDRTVLKTRQ